ncbi:hypothetical protein A2U01_0078129, partial [Trifolium medium]|nr:hypothetical protein [Trifolium medium]
MGLIFYIHQGLEVDLAGVIATEIRNIVESGIRPGKLKPNCQLGFPGLIMGLCSASRLHLPQYIHARIGSIDDDY